MKQSIREKRGQSNNSTTKKKKKKKKQKDFDPCAVGTFYKMKNRYLGFSIFVAIHIDQQHLLKILFYTQYEFLTSS